MGDIVGWAFFNAEGGPNTYFSAITPDITEAPGATINLKTGALNEQAITVTYNSALFTDGSSSTALSGANASVTKTLSATTGTWQVTYNINNSNYTDRSADITIEVVIDTTPNAFTFIDVTDADINELQTSNPIVISGLDAAVNAVVTVTGAASRTYSKNGGAYTNAAGTANNNDSFIVQYSTGGSYSTGYSTTLNVGTGSDVFNATTKAVPNPVLQVPFSGGVALPISMSAMKAFFGAGNINDNLQAFLKGQGLVPNIAVNSLVPTSVPIKISDFVGSGIDYTITNNPTARSVSYATVNGGTTHAVIWNLGLGWDTSSNNASKISYSIAYGTQTGINTTPVITPASYATPTLTTNNTLTITATSVTNADTTITGIVTFRAEHVDDPSKVLTITAAFAFLLHSNN